MSAATQPLVVVDAGAALDAAEEEVERALRAVLAWQDDLVSEWRADEGGRLVAAYGEACRRAGMLDAGGRG